MEVFQAQMAEILGITDKTLRNLKREIPPARKEGTRVVYDLAKAVQDFIAYRVDASKDRFTPEEVISAKFRKAIAEADKEAAQARSAIVQAARDEGQVALVEDVALFVSRNNERVKAKLLSAIPGKAGQLVGIKEAEQAKAILISMCNGALGELAEWTPEEVALLERPPEAAS